MKVVSRKIHGCIGGTILLVVFWLGANFEQLRLKLPIFFGLSQRSDIQEPTMTTTARPTMQRTTSIIGSTTFLRGNFRTGLGAGPVQQPTTNLSKLIPPWMLGIARPENNHVPRVQKKTNPFDVAPKPCAPFCTKKAAPQNLLPRISPREDGMPFTRDPPRDHGRPGLTASDFAEKLNNAYINGTASSVPAHAGVFLSKFDFQRAKGKEWTMNDHSYIHVSRPESVAPTHSIGRVSVSVLNLELSWSSRGRLLCSVPRPWTRGVGVVYSWHAVSLTFRCAFWRDAATQLRRGCGCGFVFPNRTVVANLSRQEFYSRVSHSSLFRSLEWQAFNFSEQCAVHKFRPGCFWAGPFLFTSGTSPKIRNDGLQLMMSEQKHLSQCSSRLETRITNNTGVQFVMKTYNELVLDSIKMHALIETKFQRASSWTGQSWAGGPLPIMAFFVECDCRNPGLNQPCYKNFISDLEFAKEVRGRMRAYFHLAPTHMDRICPLLFLDSYDRQQPFKDTVPLGCMWVPTM